MKTKSGEYFKIWLSPSSGFFAKPEQVKSPYSSKKVLNCKLETASESMMTYEYSKSNSVLPQFTNRLKTFELGKPYKNGGYCNILR